jgi:hypothetical protein
LFLALDRARVAAWLTYDFFNQVDRENGVERSYV